MITIDGQAPIPVLGDDGKVHLFDLASNKVADGDVIYGYAGTATGHSNYFTLPGGSWDTGSTPLAINPPSKELLALHVWPALYNS